MTLFNQVKTSRESEVAMTGVFMKRVTFGCRHAQREGMKTREARRMKMESGAMRLQAKECLRLPEASSEAWYRYPS